MERGRETEREREREKQRYLRWTPHPVIVTMRDNEDYIRVLLHSYYTILIIPLLQGGGSS